jgi:putative hydrolase of the HAD superfamily
MAEIPGETGAMCHWPTVQAMPNARESLKALSTMAHCHLATNAKDSAPYDIMRALGRVGLDSFLGRIFCFRAIGYTNHLLNSLSISPKTYKSALNR